MIIDMQRDFIEPGGFGAALGNQVEPLQKIVPTVAGLLTTFRELRLPIIHTREGHRPDLSDCPPAKEAVGIPSASEIRGRWDVSWCWENPGNDFVKELRPEPGELVIDKPGKGRVLRHQPTRASAGPLDQPFDLYGSDHRGLCPNQHERSQRQRI